MSHRIHPVSFRRCRSARSSRDWLARRLAPPVDRAAAAVLSEPSVFRRRMRALVPFIAIVLIGSASRGDGPADNLPDNVRRIPKLGIEVTAEQRAALQSGLDELANAIDRLRASKNPNVAPLLPDVQIFWQAVHDALVYQEFFAEREVGAAMELIEEGKRRAEHLSRGESPWTTARGLVVRGYVSRIDGSVQPYGLVVPESFQPESPHRHRLDLWFHGRGETLSEVNFLDQRRRQAGTFAPADGIVLHPYGRYSNANKFAGEIDVLEAIDSVRGRYRIDDDRIVVRGFSMGGASTWQLAAHYPGRWAAANPGAGFSETPEFLRVFQEETLNPTWWERKLWHWYDCTDWAGNLFHCPTVAYSGENDRQKQAADIMATALKREGIELVHIIGPATGHSYHPDAAAEVERRIGELAARGREQTPRVIDFTTYTLRYNEVGWLRIDGLVEHWERARVRGVLAGSTIQLQTRNVAELTIRFAPGESPMRGFVRVQIRDDDHTSNEAANPGDTNDAPPQALTARRDSFLLRSDRSAELSLHRSGNEWRLGAAHSRADGAAVEDGSLRKRHGLQGPIDDAFLDAFVFVRPTGKCRSDAIENWTHAELDRAIEHWRRHFRGHPRVKDDRDVTDEEIASMNLVLWGDSQANSILAKLAERLPIRGDESAVIVGDRRFDAAHHAPILIYPNPLNPRRYVVLNSSFTFRDYAYLNNARQVAKLPDWAIVDVRTPPDSLWPGKIVAADFFDERWGLKPARAE